MKLHRSQPENLTPYIHRLGDMRQDDCDERVFEEPPEDRLDELFRDRVAFEPLFDYEQPTRKQISYVLAGCCVLVLVVLVIFAATR